MENMDRRLFVLGNRRYDMNNRTTFFHGIDHAPGHNFSSRKRELLVSFSYRATPPCLSLSFNSFLGHVYWLTPCLRLFSRYLSRYLFILSLTSKCIADGALDCLREPPPNIFVYIHCISHPIRNRTAYTHAISSCDEQERGGLKKKSSQSNG